MSWRRQEQQKRWLQLVQKEHHVKFQPCIEAMSYGVRRAEPHINIAEATFVSFCFLLYKMGKITKERPLLRYNKHQPLT